MEANKIKEVLSANQEYPVKIEQLHDNLDLVTKVSRSDFEAFSDDLFAKVVLPIDDALAQV
jgi:molecular chaperone DnaK (HSP70)